MKHYYNPMSRAVTTDWILKELNIPHQQLKVDFTTEEKNLSDLHSINPMGKIPTLVDRGVVITEVAAICAYLADKYPEKELAPQLGSAERATYYRYLFITGNTLEPALSLAASGIEHPQPQSIGWGDTSRVMSTIESMTPKTKWVLDQKFSAADIVFGGLLDFATIFKWMQPSAKVAAYIKRIRQRPCYQQSHQAFLKTTAQQ